jgi:AcrR family transcriptional regulator
MGERSGDTRARIQEVALELFTEQGYEQTSLREIAERLGVTKAALYYHFKSKDEIVNSFLDDSTAQIDELIDWADGLSPGPETRREVIERYAHDMYDSHQHAIMRFFEQNQATLRGMAKGQAVRERMMRLVHALAGPHASPTDRLRATTAVLAVHTSPFVITESELTDDQRREVAVRVANEILERVGSVAAASADPGAGRAA